MDAGVMVQEVHHPIGQKGPKPLDRVRAAIRSRHYSSRTEEAYVHWMQRFIFYHGVRSPADRLPLSAGPIHLPIPADGLPLALHPGLDSIACGPTALLPSPRSSAEIGASERLSPGQTGPRAGRP